MASEQDIAAIVDTLIAEGYAEGPEGMRRIAETILNRAEQRGISPAEVVRQRAQYTGYENPGPAARQAQALPTARSAAQAAWLQAQGPDDPTGGANHYFNPNIVTPSWASAMTPTGQYGNHAFYTDRPATSVPRLPPSPVSISPTGAAIRQMTSPSGGNTGLPPALDRVATRERNRVVPASAEDRVTARNRAIWQTPADPFNGDPMTPASGPVVASIPTLPRPPSSGIGAPPVTRPVQSVSVKVPPVPASVEERATARNRPIWQAQTKAETARLASLYANGGPTRPNAPPMSNGVGAGANVDRQRLEQIATRPRNAQVNRLPATAGIDFDANPAFPQPTQSGGLSRDALIRQRQYAANQLNPPLATPPMVAAPRVSLPNATQLATATGFRIPQPMKQGMPPLPIPRPVGVATQLAVQPMPPMPIPRPPMGMGGGEILPPFPATMGPITALRRSMPAFPALRPPTSPAAQRVWMTGFPDSESSGGAHGGSDKDKHRGEPMQLKGRSY